MIKFTIMEILKRGSRQKKIFDFPMNEKCAVVLENAVIAKWIPHTFVWTVRYLTMWTAKI